MQTMFGDNDLMGWGCPPIASDDPFLGGRRREARKERRAARKAKRAERRQFLKENKSLAPLMFMPGGRAIAAGILAKRRRAQSAASSTQDASSLQDASRVETPNVEQEEQQIQVIEPEPMTQEDDSNIPESDTPEDMSGSIPTPYIIGAAAVVLFFFLNKK